MSRMHVFLNPNGKSRAAKDKAAKERREKGVSEVVIELLAEWVKQ
jgi:hypothetical protein